MGLMGIQVTVMEEVLPPNTGVVPVAYAASGAEFAIRIVAEGAIKPDSVWASAGVNGKPVRVVTSWRPAQSPSAPDGWAVVRITECVPPSATLIITSGAQTIDLRRVGPVTESFRIDAGMPCAWDEKTPYLVEDDTIAPLPAVMAYTASHVYRVGPAGAFGKPFVALIPVSGNERPEALCVYYYSESDRHRGWYSGENVGGWMVPHSRTVVEKDHRLYIQVEVNHSGVLELGRPARVQLGSVATLDVGANGSLGQWLSVIVALTSLSVIFLRAKRGRK
jgi:hypothetical protein